MNEISSTLWLRIILLYIYSEDGFYESKYVAVNYLKCYLIKVVFDSIFTLFIRL